MSNLISIPVNEINRIEISEFQLFSYIQRYASEYGFLWWHNDRSVFKYWLAHETIWNGRSTKKRKKLTVEDFDVKKDFNRCMDNLLVYRICKN